MNEDKIGGLLAGVFFMCIGIYFREHWIGIGLIIFSVLGIIGTFSTDNEKIDVDGFVENSVKSTMACQHCGETLAAANMFNSANNPKVKLFSADTPRVKQDGIDIGLNIYPMLCLKCFYVSEYASDPLNVSGKAKNGFEYFKVFKLNKAFKKKLLSYAELTGNDRIYKIIDSIDL
jgi:hypothetical protein